MGTETLQLDVALTPYDIKPFWRDMVCIVVDVLRASSTIVSLLDQGTRCVYAVRSIAAARALARDNGALIGGERDGLTLPGFDFGNSPFEIRDMDFRGKAAVLTTTNGTKVINKVAQAQAVLIGSFLNASACSRKALELASKDGSAVGIVCAGEKGRFVLDDAFCAGFLVKASLKVSEELGVKITLSDAARAAHRLFDAFPDIRSGFVESRSGRRLFEIEREEDLDACGRVDITNTVPVLIKGDLIEFRRL